MLGTGCDAVFCVPSERGPTRRRVVSFLSGCGGGGDAANAAVGMAEGGGGEVSSKIFGPRDGLADFYPLP
ncbi:hypothetical protein H6P81_012960 [Aristolochia fimbriata]|uniref:Uncharacterized protein n=1 Tax=Aristolochia fimbriata TaxID=158543 RepID=A0AAV7EGX4_ARIFI|nr:hypothetical protein H6P81_012960 [Aristolochia fimbriata]